MIKLKQKLVFLLDIILISLKTVVFNAGPGKVLVVHGNSIHYEPILVKNTGATSSFWGENEAI